MNFFKKPSALFVALVAALYGNLAVAPNAGASAACLSSNLVDLTAKVETAWGKYYPHVTQPGALFFPDESPEGSKSRYDELNTLLTDLRALDLSRIEDRIIRERYVQVIQQRTRAYELKAETWWGKYYEDGLHYPLNNFASAVKNAEAGKGDDALLEMYKAFPAFVDQWVAKMDHEAPDYFFQVEKIDFDVIHSYIDDWAGTKDAYAAPFGTQHAAEVDAVVAAWAKLKDAYDPTKSTKKVLRSFEKPGIKNLPNGDELYKWHMMTHLTSHAPEYSAEALHEQGKEITDDLNARCLKAYAKAANKEGANDLKEMNDWILTSPTNNPYTNYTEVLDEYNRAGMKISTFLTKEYGNFPICPYTIVTCFDLDPSGAQCGGGIAYYMPGTFKDGVCEAAGTYVLDFAENGDTIDFPKSMTTTLLMHEAVPGHHQQVMLGQEADPECVPAFIGQAGYLNVMVEGWALYSETTGFNMGAFDDPLQEIGHYQDRLLRSARLVVDTGIHHFDWGMEDCVQYLLNNSGFSEQGIRAQCARYAAWPAQALAYMVGSLAYENARHKAEEALGEKFDPRPFHKTMLQYGDMAVDQIAELGADFVKRQQSPAQPEAPAPETPPTTEADAAAPESSSSSSGFSAGALAGGVVGGAVLGLIIGAVVSRMMTKRKYAPASESGVELTGKA